MALFVDGNISTLQDLRAQESSVLEMASDEGIDLSCKLDLAQQELELRLEDFLRINNEGEMPEAGLEKVVVSPALRRWHCLCALMLTYRDAYQSQPSERYRAKFETYSGLQAQAGAQVLSRGLGLVRNPVHDPEGLGSDERPDYYVVMNQRIRRG